MLNMINHDHNEDGNHDYYDGEHVFQKFPFRHEWQSKITEKIAKITDKAH